MYSAELTKQDVSLPESTSSSILTHSTFASGLDIRQAGGRLDRQDLAEQGMRASLQPDECVKSRSTPSAGWAAVGVHVLTGSLCLSVLLDQYNGTLFCWHPMLMTVGFLGLMAEGVLLAIDFRPLDGPRRVRAIQVHALVQLTSAASIAGAFWAIWQNKVNHGKSHYTSWHGKIGLGACLAGLAAVAGGAVSFRKLGLLQRFPEPLQAQIKLAHRLAGPAVLAAALVNAFIGLGHPAAGDNGTLHFAQRAGVVLLGAAEAYLLWGGALMARLGLGATDKLV